MSTLFETLKSQATKYLRYQSGRHRLVAFAVTKGRVVSVGVNNYTKTHPKQKLFAVLVGEPDKQYLHAEIAAIIKAKQPIEELYVYRMNRSGDFLNAKPCAICQEAINISGIRAVYYS